MTFQDTTQRIKRVGQIPVTFAHRFMTIPTAPMPASHWMLIGVVGIGLGIYILIIPTLVAIVYPLFPIEVTDLISPSILKALLLLSPICLFGAILLGALGYLRYLLIAVILLEIPFDIDIFLGRTNWEQEGDLGAIAGFSISPGIICLAILYAWWLAQILSKRTRLPSRSLFQLGPSLAYLAFVSLSVVAAHDVLFFVFGFVLIIQSVLLYIYIVYTTRTRQDVFFIVSLLFIGLFLSSLLLIAMEATGATGAATGASIEQTTRQNRQDYGRVVGPLGDSNVTGSYLTLMLAIVFSVLATSVNGWYKLLAGLTVGLGGIALLSTGSRGAWMGLGISITLFCWFAWREGRLSLKIPIAYFILVLVIAAIFYEPLSERLFSEQADEAALSRVPLNLMAIEMIKDHFLFGVGANNFALNLQWYFTAEFAGAWANTVHNQYLLVWSETGIGALVAYLWFLLATLYWGWQAWKRQDHFLSPLALGMSTGIVAWMIHMTVDKFNHRVQLVLLWVVAGLIIAIYNMGRQEIVQDAEKLPKQAWQDI